MWSHLEDKSTEMCLSKSFIFIKMGVLSSFFVMAGTSLYGLVDLKNMFNNVLRDILEAVHFL